MREPVGHWRTMAVGMLVAALLTALLAACSPASTSTTAPLSARASAATGTPGGAPAASASPTAVVTIGWVGDTTPGSKYGLADDHGRALFAGVRSQLGRPDIMAGNLEGTFGTGGKSKSDELGGGAWSFQAPPSYAKALRWAGFDLMNLANNHTYDYRDAGLASTKTALDSAGLAYTGLDGQITVVERRGIRVAFIGVSPYWWTQSLKNAEDTAWLVTRARKRADVVIVIMHAGAEGVDRMHTPAATETAFGEFRGSVRSFSHAMIDAGASAVLGSGPHVLRGIERYKSGLVAYSLGNFAGLMTFSTAGDQALSGMLTLRISGAGKVLGGQWTSLRLNDEGIPQPDPSGDALALVRRLSAADFKTPWPIDSQGTLKPAE